MNYPGRRHALLSTLLPIFVGCGDNGSTDQPDAGSNPAPDAVPEVDAPPPPPAGIQFFDLPIAVDVTPDGRTAAFQGFTATEARLYLYDTITGETTPGPTIGDPSRNIATGIANTGRVSALHGEPVQAGLWMDPGGWVDLGSPHATGCGADEISGAFDLSADGSVVVGLAWNGCTPDAFRWTDASGTGVFTTLEVLGTPFDGDPGPPTNRATVISDDGRIAAGFAQNGPIDRSPAVWSQDGTGVMLDPTNMEVPGEVLSINADGTTVAGLRGFDGFVWTSATGFVDLVRFDLALPSDPVYPNAMTADGSLIFGGVGDAFFGIPIAFVWSAEQGMRVLADVVIASGVALPEGTILNSVLGVSSDGTILIGTAMDAGFASKTFALRLPANAFDGT